MPGLAVGVARIDYQPKVGLPIMGHWRRDYASTGVHDPLYCRAMVFHNGVGAKVAIVSLDLCVIDREQVAFLRAEISKQCGIAGGNIIVCATHTHGGPATVGLYDSPKADDEDIHEFLKRAAQAVVQAEKKLAPAILHVGRANEARLSFNRRLKCRDGKTHMNWESLDPGFVAEALGPVDTELITLSIRNADRGDVPIACLVNFALHSAVIDYENSEYTADFPGYLSEAMRKTMGDGYISLYANGCCGNVNHIDYADKDAPRRGFVMAQRVGYMVAAASCQAMRNEVAVASDALAASSELVRLRRLQISDEQYNWALDMQKSSGDITDKGDGLSARHMAPLLIDLRALQGSDDQVEVMVMRIGELAVVALPGECFTEFGLTIKKNSPAEHTIVIELANDAIGYLPTAEAFDQGGYEVTPGATRYDRGAGEKVMRSALSQLDKLFDRS